MTLYDIPAHIPFLDALARGVVQMAGRGGDPAALARTTLLLPNRRAARALRESFLRAAGRNALLLPRLRPLAGLSVEEADELSLPALMDLPPAVDPARRLGVLTAMVMRLPPRFGGPSNPDQAWRLAQEMATLLDEMALEGCDAAHLRDLVPEGLARHWQVTHLFLEGVIAEWRGWLDGQVLMDIGDRRIAALHAQAEAWRAGPPADPVIAAGIGIGGTIPAAVELLKVVAGLPRGAVVMHGAGEDVPRALWDQLRDAHTHPHSGQSRLLDAMGAPAYGLPVWPGCGPGDDRAMEARAELFARALRPAEGIDCWQEREPDRWRPALGGLTLLTAPDEAGEAAAIALLLREAIEKPGARAALVTPDRDLARRVSVELARHGVLADDSAGMPLGSTPTGAFLRLIARMVAERFAPVPLLAVLKHPLCAGGMDRQTWMRAVREMERAVLRGPRPAPGLGGLRLAADAIVAGEVRERAQGLVDALARCLGGFDDLAESVRPPADLLAEHLAAAEALAATARQPGGLALYVGEEGEPLALHLAALAPAMDALPPVSAAAWPGLFDAALDGALAPGVRNLRGRKGGGHPRVQILGLLEARLQSFDRVVLGALEESIWPLATDPGPWMSRPMRRAFGLPEPEARIGRVAADFVLTALAAPDAVLSRARKRGGAPTVPARWLTRIETFLRGQTGPDGRGLALRPSDAMAWAARLDAPAAVQPAARPAPNPPAALRPRRLTIGDVWLLQADPYAWYARRMLELFPLDDLDAEAGASQYGNIVHDALAAWTAQVEREGHLGPQAELWFEAAAEDALQRHAPRPGLVAFWRPRLSRIGAFVVEAERARAGIAHRRAEVKGGLNLGDDVMLEGRADRVDLRADGRIELIDFKTGAPPPDSHLRDGRAPQMPLEAAMAIAGGFPGVPAAEVALISHWRLAGGYEPGEVRDFPADAVEIASLAGETLDHVRQLARDFLLNDRPFLARPHPERSPKGGEYDHLSRAAEWGGAEENEA